MPIDKLTHIAKKIVLEYNSKSYDINAPYNQVDWPDDVKYRPIIDECDWLTDDLIDKYYDEMPALLDKALYPFIGKAMSNTIPNIINKYKSTIVQDFTKLFNTKFGLNK